MRTACAWCAAEQNEKHNGNTTHGICQRHYEQMMVESGTLVHIAKRLLEAHAKCNKTDFRAALEEMRQAVAEIDGEQGGRDEEQGN